MDLPTKLCEASIKRNSLFKVHNIRFCHLQASHPDEAFSSVEVIRTSEGKGAHEIKASISDFVASSNIRVIAYLPSHVLKL